MNFLQMILNQIATHKALNSKAPPKKKSILSRIKKVSKDTVDVANARNKVLTGCFIPDQIGEFEGYPMFKYDTYVHATIAIPPSVPGVMFRTEGAIVVNQRFMECPESVREASLLHELGHLTYKHSSYSLKDKFLFTFFGSGKMFDHDCEADKFAIERGADIVGALEYYSQFDFIQKKSLEKRIARIKVLSK